MASTSVAFMHPTPHIKRFPAQLPSLKNKAAVRPLPARLLPCAAAAASSSPGTPPLNAEGLAEAGPSEASPDYAAIDAQPLNRLIYSLFRNKMVAELGEDSSVEGYGAIIDLTRRLNALGMPRDTQVATRRILNSLFPSWLPGAFKVMFARPLPELSYRLNAFATWATCQWLMGECEVNDVEIDGGKIGSGHGVLVARCRYLEEAGCASVCINSCKVPTQEFFLKDMGLPLTMTPDYSNFSCQFSFGLTPGAEGADPALATPCFAQCPTAARAAAAAGKKVEAAAPACHKIMPNE